MQSFVSSHLFNRCWNQHNISSLIRDTSDFRDLIMSFPVFIWTAIEISSNILSYGFSCKIFWDIMYNLVSRIMSLFKTNLSQKNIFLRISLYTINSNLNLFWQTMHWAWTHVSFKIYLPILKIVRVLERPACACLCRVRGWSVRNIVFVLKSKLASIISRPQPQAPLLSEYFKAR